jgi:TRAP-type uncharacterized transport system substrate-binding protein
MEMPPGYPGPTTSRARVMLEVASELVGMDGWADRHAYLLLGEGRPDTWRLQLMGSSLPAHIDQVARGELHIATLNPAAPLTLAYRGTGPYREPLPIRVITTLPSLDMVGFAVSEQTGLSSLTQIAERRVPLRLSLRRPDDSTTWAIRQVVAAAGFTLEDLVAWGGEVRYDGVLPEVPSRWGRVERGEVDALFDEAIPRWAPLVPAASMRFLPLEESLLGKLEAMGFRRGVIRRDWFPELPADVPTLDFSGFPFFTNANVSDAIITAFCAALEARKDRIPWEGAGPELPLDRMCRDTPEGPRDVPLHPAAERFWTDRGYLD